VYGAEPFWANSACRYAPPFVGKSVKSAFDPESRIFCASTANSSHVVGGVVIPALSNRSLR